MIQNKIIEQNFDIKKHCGDCWVAKINEKCPYENSCMYKKINFIDNLNGVNHG